MKRNKIIKSVASLSLLKSLDYLFPLIMIPMALNALGVALYGVTSYYLSLSLFYLVIVDFGFNIYGVQKVSLIKNSANIKRFIVSSFIIRAILFALVVCPIHIGLSYFAPGNMHVGGYEHWLILIAAFNVFNLQWFFQAKEKFRLMISISLSVRLSALLWTYFGVHNESDIRVYVNTLVLMYGVPYVFHFLYFWVTYKNIKMAVVKRKYTLTLFSMNSSIFGYRIANAAILPWFNYIFGFMMTSTEFGVMSLIQRIFGAVINFSAPILQALIPFFSSLKRNDTTNFSRIYNKSFVYTLISSVVLSCFSVIGTYVVIYLGVFGRDISLKELFPHTLIMIAIVPHVINSLQSQVLVLNNRRTVVNHAVYTSLILVIFLCIIGFALKLTSIYFILFYLIAYYFMSIYLFFGGIEKR